MKKPSELCKQAGLSGLGELAEITCQHEQTLIRWSKEKPELFEATILGAVQVKERRKAANAANTQATMRGIFDLPEGLQQPQAETILEENPDWHFLDWNNATRNIDGENYPNPDHGFTWSRR